MAQRGDTCKTSVNGVTIQFVIELPAKPKSSARGRSGTEFPPTGDPRDEADHPDAGVSCSGEERRLAAVKALVREGRALSNAPPLVLVHGFPLNHLVWSRVSQITSERFLTIRPNLRGFGQLTNAEPFTLSSLADDLHALLEKIDALPCVLAGLSMGGYVALAFANSYRSQLLGLALVSSRASADNPQQREKRTQMIQQLHRGGTAAVVDAMLPNLLAPSTPADNPTVLEELQRIMLDTASTTIEHACLAMRDRPDLTELARTLHIPTSLIAGEQDRLLSPDEAAAVADSIGCELHAVPGAGHIAPLEQPELVADALARLMHRVTAQGHQASSPRPAR